MRFGVRCSPNKCFPPNAPRKMLSKKCSPKQNAPRQNALHQNAPQKSAPPKKCSPEKFSGFTYHRQSQQYVNPDNSFKSVDEGRTGEHFFSGSILKGSIFLGGAFGWRAFFREHFTGSIYPTSVQL